MKKLLVTLVVSFGLGIVVASSAPHTADAAPVTPNPYWTSVCCTAAGNCQTGQVVQNGTPCWCNFGTTVWGNAC